MTAPVVTAVAVGSGLSVHAVWGARTRQELSAPGLDTLCGARSRVATRHHRGRLPELHLASAGYGITCRRCRRVLDSQRVPHE